MKRAYVFLWVMMPSVAEASGGLHHAEEWILKRDGAWIFNFLILFAGIYWIMVKFIVPALKQRADDIADSITDLENAKSKAEARLKEFEKKASDFEMEKTRMKSDAAHQGDRIKRDTIDEAKAQSERILKKAKEEINSEIARVKLRLKHETVELAVSVARDALSKSVKEKEHKKIVKEYLAEIEGGR